MTLLCKVCEKRRAKRDCPGLNAGICSVCCVEGREITIDCPRSCEYLCEARKHESLVTLTPDKVPHRDVKVTEDFVRKHELLVLWLGNSLTRAMDAGRAVDSDAREALEALVQTFHTLESGLIYETRSPNPYAAALQEAINTAIVEWRARVAEVAGMETVRDADLLGTLIFLQRLGLQYDNGRRRGRVFYDFLMDHFPEAPPQDLAL